jgi:alpha-D-xyloside xylohydrolase
MSCDIRIDGSTGIITNGKITAKLAVDSYRHNCTISYTNSRDEVLLQEIWQARHFRPILGGDFSLTVSFAPNADEKLFGMGQYQQEILDVKNCTLELAHRNTQASVPFILSDKGYGFFWHNPAVGRATFAKNESRWFAESTKQMDYWIVAGDTPDEIVCAYAEVTGKVPMMPEYGMGFWQCKLRYWNQEQLLNIAREYKKRNIPVDVIVVDFFHWPKMGDFRFEDEFFPDPDAMVKELKSYGMELMVSVWPQVALDSENYFEMEQKGLLIKSERGVQIAMRFGGESTFFDATNPEARSYVWEKCKKNYFDYGIKVFWLDEAEPEYNVYDFDNYRYFAGPNVQIGNIYPQLFSRAFYDGQSEAGQENIVNLVRCAWAGSQRYGALVWSGDIRSDWSTFRKQLCAGLNMGISGIPWWTTDIGGFYDGDPDDKAFQQLLVRWFQWGTFCPVMRLHGDRVSQTRSVFRKDGTENMFTGGENEIWSFGDDNTPILEKYIRLREAMRPYIRGLMEEAHLYGRPAMRAMFYEFPHDEICWNLQDQYMFGNKLLVAPIMYENSYKRTVYLPKGETWISVFDKKIFDGGQVITVDAPIDIIPVFTRDRELLSMFSDV